MTDEQLRKIDRLVAEKIFDRTGIGYYAAPLEGPDDHIHRVRFDTYEEALSAELAHYHKKFGPVAPKGYITPKELDPSLCYWKDGWGPILVDDYSQCISAAWSIIDHWGVLPWQLDNCWREVNFERVSGITCTVTTHADTFIATAETAPLAICLCALKAVGVDVEKEIGL